jgi:CBS domain containing-hemolysin-like protein
MLLKSIRNFFKPELSGDADNGDPLSRSSDENELLINIRSLSQLEACDVMIPRVDVVALSSDSTYNEFLQTYAENRIDSLFVYQDDLDHMIGVLSIYDFIKLSSDYFSPLDHMRPVFFISPSMKTIDLLLHMRETGNKHAIVVDEYGGVDGLITFDDLMEEIIGDIRDAHESSLLRTAGDGSVLVEGRTRLDELDDFIQEEEVDGVTTIGGLVTFKLGHLPLNGEQIILQNGVIVEVVDSDPRRIKLVALRNLPASSNASNNCNLQAKKDDE